MEDLRRTIGGASRRNITDALKQRWWTGGIGVYLVIFILLSLAVIFLRWPETVPGPPFIVGTKYTGNDSSLVVGVKIRPDSTVLLTVPLRPDTSQSFLETIVHTPLAGTADLTRTIIPDSIFVAAEGHPSGQNILVLILFIGALGASLHALTSLAEYVGNRQFELSWMLWYFLRPFVGATLALLFYFVLRAGFLPQSPDMSTLYGILAVAGLIGLFSKQALYKLSDLFDVLFQSDKERKLRGKLQSLTPVIDAFDPPRLKANTQERLVTVIGQNFIDVSKIWIDDEVREDTEYLSNMRLTIMLHERDVASPRRLKVVVVNPSDKGGSSQSQYLTVEE